MSELPKYRIPSPKPFEIPVPGPLVSNDIERQAVHQAYEIFHPNPFHEEWTVVDIHTAKCDMCNLKNSSKMTRCADCARQVCHPCFVELGENFKHRADEGALGWRIEEVRPKLAAERARSIATAETKARKLAAKRALKKGATGDTTEEEDNGGKSTRKYKRRRTTSGFQAGDKISVADFLSLDAKELGKPGRRKSAQTPVASSSKTVPKQTLADTHGESSTAGAASSSKVDLTLASGNTGGAAERGKSPGSDTNMPDASQAL